MNALANIAVTGSKNRDRMIEEGVVPKLDQALTRKSVPANVYRAGIFLISNLVGCAPVNPLAKVRSLQLSR